MNKNDIIQQAQWEIYIEAFEKEVAKEKARILNKKAWFPWRIKLINLNKEYNNGN